MIALYARTEPQDMLVRVGRKYATLDKACQKPAPWPCSSVRFETFRCLGPAHSKPFSFKEKRLLPHRIKERSRDKSPRFARKRRAALLKAALHYLENHDNFVESE